MGKLTWKSHCRHLTKLKLGNARRFFFLFLLFFGASTFFFPCNKGVKPTSVQIIHLCVCSSKHVWCFEEGSVVFVARDSAIELKVPGIFQIRIIFSRCKQNRILLSVIIIKKIQLHMSLSLGIFISKVGVILPALEGCFENYMREWMNDPGLFTHSGYQLLTEQSFGDKCQTAKAAGQALPLPGCAQPPSHLIWKMEDLAAATS